jgi:hypothetical protein
MIIQSLNSIDLMENIYKEMSLNYILMDFSLTIKNKEVWEFYNENKNVDFEDMSLFFVRLLKKIITNSAPNMTSNVVSQLLENVKVLQSQVTNMTDNFAKSQQDINANFTMKFIEYKKEYVEDLKMILSHNNSEKVAPIIREYNDSLLDKTRIMINDIIPKNQETLSKNIEKVLVSLHKSINQEITELSRTSINKDNLDGFIKTLDEKFSKTLVGSQNLFNSILTSTETRLDTKLTELKDISTTNNSSQNQLQTNIHELLRKMDNSSSKGKISENILYNILIPLFPTAQIESVGTVKETGDILMVRKNKPQILFENKNYDRNVGQEEVKKFIRDIENQNCSGIMMAQHFGICNKDNFEIELHNNNVIVYLHKVEYDAEKIKVAVDIIDYFKSMLHDIEESDGDGVTISKGLLDDINKEYQSFVANKLAHIKTIKDYSQKLLAQAEEMKIPCLETYLSKIFATATSSKDNVCEYCNYAAKNTRALSAHYRGCEHRKTHVTSLAVNTMVPNKGPGK